MTIFSSFDIIKEIEITSSSFSCKKLVSGSELRYFFTLSKKSVLSALN